MVPHGSMSLRLLCLHVLEAKRRVCVCAYESAYAVANVYLEQN